MRANARGTITVRAMGFAGAKQHGKRAFSAPSEVAHPLLFHQIDSERAHRLRPGTIEPHPGIKRAGRPVTFMGPKRHAVIPDLPRVPHARPQKPLAHPQTPHLGFHEKQPELRQTGLRPLHAEDRANAPIPPRARSSPVRRPDHGFRQNRPECAPPAARNWRRTLQLGRKAPHGAGSTSRCRRS
jgi:hypothetical protein